MQPKPLQSFVKFLIVFCALACIPALYFVNEFSRVHDTAIQNIEQAERNKLEYANTEFIAITERITSIVRSLTSGHLLESAITTPSKENSALLTEFWSLAMNAQGYFSQLRVLDPLGMELIRFNQIDGQVQITDKPDLQYKGHRDYFDFAKQLPAGAVRGFGIDLEIEHNELIQPLTPAMRVIVPLDYNGQRHGYFIANLDLKRIYTALSYSNEEHMAPYIINREGYYVMTPSGEKLMGHLIDKNSDRSVPNELPKLWAKIQTANQGTVYENERWYSFTNISLASSHSNLTFFFPTSNQEVLALVNQAYDDLTIRACFIFFLIFAFSVFFVHWNDNHDKNSLESQIARAAINGMSAVVITDKNNRIIRVNKEFTRVSGYTFDEVVGQQPSLFASNRHNQQFYINMWKALQNDGMWEGEIINKRKDGSELVELLRIQCIEDNEGTIQYYVASFVDITRRKQLEDRLRELTERDELSGLWNRRKFDMEIKSAVARSVRYGEKAALCLFDIDHFKRINDEKGHDIGDQAIRDVSRILGEHIRDTDVLARIGGEEFAVIMPHTSVESAEIVANRLRTAVYVQSDLPITISAGVSDLCDSKKRTYKRADLALYEAKALGRNQVSVLTSEESEAIA